MQINALMPFTQDVSKHMERLTIKSQVKKEEVTNELRKRISEMVVP